MKGHPYIREINRAVSMNETLMTYLRNIISLEQAVYVETSG